VREAIFIPVAEEPGDGHGRYHATVLARGPWDPRAQHGGAPAALLVHTLELLGGGDHLELARITYEFMRPVPLGDLDVRAERVRPGRRVQLLEASIHDADGTEVVRARALRVRQADDVPPEAISAKPPPPRPARSASAGHLPGGERPMFGTDGCEIRLAERAGTSTDGDPPASVAWFRLLVPLVEGVEPTPLERLAAAGDFGNGISSVLPWDDYVFINPDLTLYVEREPIGEWIGLESTTRIGDGGVGLAESILYDERGRVGRALQSLFVARR
jgi:hypothetical protein